MIMEVAAIRVIVVVIATVTVEIARMIATIIVKATIVAMIDVNPLVIKRMKL